jgi:hypothetical protein
MVDPTTCLHSVRRKSSNNRHRWAVDMVKQTAGQELPDGIMPGDELSREDVARLLKTGILTACCEDSYHRNRRRPIFQDPEDCDGI